MKLSDGWLLSTNLSLSLLRTISRAASTGMSPGLAPIASPVRIRTATSQVPNTASQAFFTYVCQDVGSHDCAICVFYHIVNFQWFVRVVINVYICILFGPENVLQVERIRYDQKQFYKNSHASCSSL